QHVIATKVYIFADDVVRSVGFHQVGMARIATEWSVAAEFSGRSLGQGWRDHDRCEQGEALHPFLHRILSLGMRPLRPLRSWVRTPQARFHEARQELPLQYN